MNDFNESPVERDVSVYPRAIVDLARNPPLYTRMNDFTSSAFMKGACGDSMEFYLYIKEGVIEQASFYTDGCVSTRACGSVAAQFVSGKRLEEALAISPKMILDRLDGLPADFNHCAVLAVMTFLKAAAEYLLQP